MAIVLKDGERLSLRSWEYNSARILTALASMVKENGGRVKPTNTAIITDWNVTDALRSCSMKIDALQKATAQFGPSTAREEAIANYTRELERFSAVANTPITVTHTSYISFIINDRYIYYQTDSNPYFPFLYSKTQIRNGKYSLDACLDEEPKEWLLDCYVGCACSDEEIKAAAEHLYNFLLSVNCTPINRDRKETRVPNTYDGGYHTEKIPVPERFSTIDF